MTRFPFRGRPSAASKLRAALISGAAISLCLVLSRELYASPDWAVPYGGEFWRPAAGISPRLLSAGNAGLASAPHPNLGEAIERVQHAFRPSPESGSWTAPAHSFRAQLSDTGLHFHPAASDQEAAIAFRTCGIHIGDEFRELTNPTSTRWTVVGNTAQRLLDARLQLVEHVESRAAGVEVSWVLNQAPAVRGDVIINWEVRGRERLQAAGSDWRVAGDLPEPNIIISQAVAVDSKGKRLPLKSHATEHGLSIVVPQAFLEGAAFPIAVDPLISTEFDLDQPVTTAAPSAQFAPAIASDGTNYLVVWHDNRNGPKLDLYAARVTTNGAVLDPSGFAITTATNDQWYPAVAFNGTNYLVAWQDARAGSQDVYATRVTPDGRVLETNGLAVVITANDQRVPAVASLNGDFLVVWQDGRNGAANQDIYASRIRGSGLLVETNGFLVSNANNSQSAPAVGVVGTNYVAAWHDFRSGVGLDVYAARITRTGAVLDANAIAVSTVVNDQWNVAVAGNGSTGLITWQDGRNGTDEDVFGARINEAGAVLDPGGLGISQQPNQQRLPAVNQRGNGFYVVWQDNRSGGSFDVYGTTVGAADDVIGSASGTLLSDAPNDQRFVALAGTGDQLLVVWEDIRNGVSTDIFGTRVDAVGTSLDGGNLVVSTVSNAQETPAVAGNGSMYLAVWRDFRADSLGDIYGVRLAADGTVLDPLGLVICNAGNYQLAPRVASSGGDFLVVWQDFRNGVHDDVLGTRVTSDGAVLDPGGLLVSTALGTQRLPDVAGGANGYLVVWQDRRSGTSDDIYGTRIGLDGAVLEANGLAICVALGDQQAPAAAGLNDRYFIAWEDFRGGVVNRVFGTGLPASGPPTTANGFEMSAVAGAQQAPRIVASTNQFLAVWQGQTNGGGYDLFGTRILQSGVVLDTNAITINAAAGDQTRPAIASKGADFVVVWEDQRNIGRTNLYSTRLTANGTVLEPAGELTVSDTGKYRSPAIANAAGDYLLVYQTPDVGNITRVRGVIQYPAAQPTISLSPGSAQYVSGAGAVAIDPTAILVDAVNANFESGTLTVDLTANATGNDRLGILHQGSGPGQIGVSGNTVSYGGVLIGFFTGGSSGSSPLLIIFSGAATAEAVEALARNISFNNVASQPFTQPRSVRFALSLLAGAGTPTSRTVDVIDAGSIPAIITQPLAQTVNSGGQVNLSVVASGSQPIRYQWRLNGVNITGATNASYSISNLQAATAGAYTVVVSNQYDFVISEVAAVACFDIEMYAGLTIAGPSGANYRVEWRPAVGDTTTWQTLTNVTLGTGSMLFFDTESNRRNQRFYRAIRQE